MASWKGDVSNPAPNSVNEPIDRSEKVIDSNRATQVRRDTDDQKNFTISLYDIDETIIDHLKQLQLQVEDSGKLITVPTFFGSPEKWTSAQRDGYLRDNQGKLILPAMILKRTNSENDQSLQFFNRYLNTPVIKLYSEKNRYTRFSILSENNAPVNEVYNVVVPSHMVLTYHFIVWTETIEQMNPLIEKIQFNTKDYWGTKSGFKFRTRVESYGHTVEVQVDDDRMVKTEFDLTTHGYILPDTMAKLDSREMTTKKMFTPKKIIIGAETVSADFDLSQFDKNRDKWRSQSYPNLQADVPIPTPGISVVEGSGDNTIAGQIVNMLKSITATPANSVIAGGTDNSVPYLRIVSTPTNITDPGQEGYVSYDQNYFYIYTNGSWRRVAISQFS